MKPKILFVFDHKKEEWWMDGLWAALSLLEKDFEIKKCNLHEGFENYELGYDFYLGWGAFGSKADKRLHTLKQTEPKVKMGLCIAGNAHSPVGAGIYNVLFHETKWYRPQINFHPNIIQAFGINSDIFGPINFVTPIVWDYIGVGAFALWKRWDKMKNKKGNRLVVGEYQKDNVEESFSIAKDLVENGVMVSDMVNPFDLANYYHWSRTLYIPANVIGGGERSVWEAKACGLRVEIEEDNPKLKELVESEAKDHYWYAKKLKEGILSCL